MKNLVDRINTLLDQISIGLIAIMVLLVWAQVFMRYVLNFSPFWIEAIARYSMIWALLLSAAVLIGRDEHVRVDFLIQMFPPAAAKVVNFILSLAILLFLVIFMVFGVETAIDNIGVRDGSIRISMFWPYLIVPISGVLMTFNLVIRPFTRRFSESGGNK